MSRARERSKKVERVARWHADQTRTRRDIVEGRERRAAVATLIRANAGTPEDMKLADDVQAGREQVEVISV